MNKSKITLQQPVIKAVFDADFFGWTCLQIVTLFTCSIDRRLLELETDLD